MRSEPRPAGSSRTAATASWSPRATRLRWRLALSRLAEDPALAERLGDQAREDVGRFTHSAMADAFEAAVEHAVAARR